MKKLMVKVAAISAVLVSTFLVSAMVSSNAQACQPPPAWYDFFGSLNAISDNRDIKDLLGFSVSPTAIKKLTRNRYEIEAGQCKLGVTMQIEQLTPNAPCGGPMTFTAIPDAALACTP